MDPVIQTVTDAIEYQFSVNAHANLLSERPELSMTVSEGFLESMENAALLLPDDDQLNQIATTAATQFVSCILSINPYVELHSRDRAILTDVYLNSAHKMISGEEPNAVLLNHHYPALRKWAESKYPVSLSHGLRQETVLGAIPYAQYSPQTQLDVLGLTAQDIRGTVFDLGCGKEARLVKYLRQRGVDAYGIDRELEKGDDEYVYAMTWFEFPLEVSSADLIVSHLAFSSHLLYQSTTAGPELDAYLGRYRSVLAALRVGGEFRYAPALPFVEKNLPDDRFVAKRWEVSDGVYAAKVKRIAL